MGTITGWWFIAAFIEQRRYVPAGTPGVFALPTSVETCPSASRPVLMPLKKTNVFGSVAVVEVSDGMVSMTTCVCPMMTPSALSCWGAAK
jgi:hypothetical protein